MGACVVSEKSLFSGTKKKKSICLAENTRTDQVTLPRLWMVAASSDRSSAQESLATAKMDFQRPLSYAPTPYSYTPNPALSSSINLDEVSPRSLISDPTNPGKEVKLASSSTERDLYESLAEIYSIIITLDGLEKAYIRDAIPEAEYTETCARLLKQYKSTLGDDTVAREFVDLETFKRTWDVCYVPCQVIVTERRLI
jgi:hypothetical protein